MIFSSVRKFRGVALAILALGGMAGTITPVLAATRLIIDTVDQGIAGKAQIVVSEGRVRAHRCIQGTRLLASIGFSDSLSL